jgi:hypothetical protein
MMNAFLWVDDHQVTRALDNLATLLSPQGMEFFLGAKMGPYLRQRAKERFDTEGDDAVGMWAPLRPATVAIRAEGPWAISGEHPINRRTGELENWVVDGGWFAYPDSLGATMQYPKTTPGGELKKKVKTAQLGDKESNTVARPVLGVGEADMAFFMTALLVEIDAAAHSRSWEML